MENVQSEAIPVISLFAGAGGMDLGFRQRGFVPVLALDINPAAINSYNFNHAASVARVGDLSSLDGAGIIALLRQVAPGIRPRGVIGGPPCQSFSVSNVHHQPSDARKKLPLQYAQILQALNDEFHLDFFVFENVEGLKTKKHQWHFRRIRRAFEAAGFNVYEQALDASQFGVPQKRRRFFLVGLNKHLYPSFQFEFPQGDNETPLTVRDALGTLPEPAFFQRALNPAEIPYHPNHWAMNPRSPKFSNGFEKSGRSFRRLPWDQPSWTVAYGHREMHVHPNGNRRVSVFEAILLQGFPSTYQLQGNFTEQVEQVSNAVPPPLANALARAMQASLYERIARLQAKLLNWFAAHQRHFPWRETSDPYQILLAEKLLQQTAATPKVVQAFREITQQYPDLKTLARASVSKLRKIIAPLGFSYRAEELPRLAQQIVKLHGGAVPAELHQLLKLPGLGDYGARAVLAFAYQQDVPIVDTNIARLLYRLHGITQPLPKNPARNRQLIEMAAALVPKGKARDFNLAALDLCALICTARQPACAGCPLREECVYGCKVTAEQNAEVDKGQAQ